MDLSVVDDFDVSPDAVNRYSSLSTRAFASAQCFWGLQFLFLSGDESSCSSKLLVVCCDRLLKALEAARAVDFHAFARDTPKGKSLQCNIISAQAYPVLICRGSQPGGMQLPISILWSNA